MPGDEFHVVSLTTFVTVGVTNSVILHGQFDDLSQIALIAAFDNVLPQVILNENLSNAVNTVLQGFKRRKARPFRPGSKGRTTEGTLGR